MLTVILFLAVVSGYIDLQKLDPIGEILFALALILAVIRDLSFFAKKK